MSFISAAMINYRLWVILSDVELPSRSGSRFLGIILLFDQHQFLGRAPDYVGRPDITVTHAHGVAQHIFPPVHVVQPPEQLGGYVRCQLPGAR